ncbi:Cytoplasmic dynein 2 intermediate chain 1 [Frankliniella fusca]|uniref:Cytoplasmic dynein 2 intermediate chain 1 n=1 Tax=Frankliniella fusca TaxID=407009 RepID=A0AAE1I0V4_9NEOP|nr:Cytoplasmic dynein 2 intermediate chain 1 [Frankliniella fusca]
MQINRCNLFTQILEKDLKIVQHSASSVQRADLERDCHVTTLHSYGLLWYDGCYGAGTHDMFMFCAWSRVELRAFIRTLASVLDILLYSPLMDNIKMSKSRGSLPAKELSNNLTDKTRSSSKTRQDATSSKNKVKQSESSQDPSKSQSENRLKSLKKTTETSSKKKTSERVTERGQGEIPPKTRRVETKTLLDNSNKTVLKPRSDSNEVSRSRVRDLNKSSVTRNPPQAMAKIKSNETLKPTSQKTDGRKGASHQSPRQGHQSSMVHKTSVLKQSLPEKPSGSPSDKIKHVETKSNKNGSEGNRLNRERTKTRTIDPESSQLMTTLQHAAQQLPQDIEQESQDDKEAEYEDDFEDYESDFEEAPSLEVSSEDTDEDLSKTANNKDDKDDDDKENYDYGDSSSSLSDMQSNKDLPSSINGKVGVEEKKMDSGHYDMAEDRKNVGKFMSTLSEAPKHEPKAKLLSDLRSSVETSTQGNSYEVKAINFAQAKRRQQERKASSRLKQRGEILLNMIHLDSVSLPLYDMAPVPYEVYMSSYGRSNTQQVSCQTNEDGMTEEVQTEEIPVKNKWTQHPPALICPDPSLGQPLICAVSSEPCDNSDMLEWRKGLKVNMIDLEKFLLNTGQLMLNILEETSSGTQGILKSNKADLGFSQGFITLGTDSVPFLENRRVTNICFTPHQPNSILSVHESCNKPNVQDDLPEQMVKRCILCLWSLLQPSQPMKLLVSSSNVTACTFHPLRSHLIFAGLADGLLNVWDLKEQNSFQNVVVFHNSEWTLKSPSYSTVDTSAMKHRSAVIGVRVLDDVNSASRGWEHSPTQICSLDEGGLCIIWTLLSSSGGTQNMQTEDVGIAPWGCVRLLQNESFSLAQRVAAVTDEYVGPHLQFADLALDSVDPSHLLAAANTGHVVHGLSSGGRTHPALYPPHWDCLAPATCICPCPYGLPYFLVGCGDGTIRLHSRLTARPLLSVAGSGGAIGAGPAISVLQWSNSRPCIFFALDCESRLHIWDLASSDMYPMLTVPFRGKIINVMQLSPQHSSKACPYLALGTTCGKLKVHLVKENFASKSLEDTAEELEKFKRYASIL